MCNDVGIKKERRKVLGIFQELYAASGISVMTYKHLIMWLIAFVVLYMAIKKEFEPLLLLPIGFGILLANLPKANLMEENMLLWYFYNYGIKSEIIPCLIFLGLGALTDFGPLIADPKTLLLGAAAQGGVYITFIGAIVAGFTVKEAAGIGIIGGADGPTTIYVLSYLAPYLMGPCAVAAYSYMAMVPVIQPPIARLLTTREERLIRMPMPRPVSPMEKVLFPIVATIVVCILVPMAAPLIALFMLGNLFRESRVVERLNDVAQNALLNIVTVFLGISVGGTMSAETFLDPKVLFIFALGVVAFASATAMGIIFAKIMNLFLKQKINPLIGGAGVSAVPMSARTMHRVAQAEDKKNYILMHAMGPNVAGVIGTAVAAGMFITLLAGK
jgi:oxaloacetate decarboxylase beta subunit